jgi:hypothetical protein
MYRLVFNQKIQIWHNGLKSSDASKKSLVATQSAHGLYISWDKIRCFRLSRSNFPEHNILLSAKIKQNCTRAFCFVGLIGCHDSVIYHTFYGPKDLYRLEGHESVMSACQCRSHHAMLQHNLFLALHEQDHEGALQNTHHVSAHLQGFKRSSGPAEAQLQLLLQAGTCLQWLREVSSTCKNMIWWAL